MFVKDLNANGIPDVGDEVWVRTAEVSADAQQRGRQEVGHQERGIVTSSGAIVVTDNVADDLIWLTATGARTLTNTGTQSISVTNSGAVLSLPGDLPIYLTETGKRTTTVTSRQSILVTNANSDGLLWLDSQREPTTINTGVAYIAGGILIEDKVQERGVQEVGFQQTGYQQRGFQERGYQLVDDNDDPLFIAPNGNLTTDFSNEPAIVVTNLETDPLLWLNFRGNRTVEVTGTQSVDVTDLSTDPLLWRDANGKRTTVDTGLQAMAITNTPTDLPIWVDANGNLTTVAGNAAEMNGPFQTRGVHERHEFAATAVPHGQRDRDDRRHRPAEDHRQQQQVRRSAVPQRRRTPHDGRRQHDGHRLGGECGGARERQRRPDYPVDLG